MSETHSPPVQIGSLLLIWGLILLSRRVFRFWGRLLSSTGAAKASANTKHWKNPNIEGNPGDQDRYRNSYIFHFVTRTS